jgi:hypothetical protein
VNSVRLPEVLPVTMMSFIDGPSEAGGCAPGASALVVAGVSLPDGAGWLAPFGAAGSGVCCAKAGVAMVNVLLASSAIFSEFVMRSVLGANASGKGTLSLSPVRLLVLRLG